ncbi:MAG: type II toxin-antitoxin system RelE/ParE family toxin [Synergistaceae bacterium]|nr:type II toxin-antitoxin system RelE/ParE family toxin [Synergistaceae bacterium]
MRRWHITGVAKRDIADIRCFTVEQWGRQKAEEYLSTLYAKIQLVADKPAIGIDRSKNLNLGVEIRSVVHVSHVIYYVVSKTGISVVGVLHQSMVLKTHLLPRLKG